MDLEQNGNRELLKTETISKKMKSEVVSNFYQFIDKHDYLRDLNPKRVESLRVYFALGGIVSIESIEEQDLSKVKSSKDIVKPYWPKLLYPDKAKILSRQKDLNSQRKKYSEDLASNKNGVSKLDAEKLIKQYKFYFDPLYWKHISKYYLEKDYKEKVDKVDLKSNLISDERYRPIVDNFVNNAQYRDNLVETVSNSIVYKKDKRIAKKADFNFNLEHQIMDKEIKELDHKLKAIDNELLVLSEMLEWANENKKDDLSKA